MSDCDERHSEGQEQEPSATAAGSMDVAKSKSLAPGAIDVETLPQRQWRATYVLRRAREMVRKGLTKEAFLLFDLAIEREPRNAKALQDRGVLLIRLKEYDKAIDDLTKSIELDPKVASAYYNRGVARQTKASRSLRLRGLKEHPDLVPEFQMAKDDYTKAIKLDRFNGHAYHNRAACFAQLRNTNRCIADLNKAALVMDESSDLHELFRSLQKAKRRAEEEAKFLTDNGENTSKAAGECKPDSSPPAKSEKVTLWERRQHERYNNEWHLAAEKGLRASQKKLSKVLSNRALVYKRRAEHEQSNRDLIRAEALQSETEGAGGPQESKVVI